jgi:hypothetical protein
MDRESRARAPRQSIDRAAIPAVELLLGPYVYVVGTSCGIVGLDMPEWMAMKALVHTGDREALHRVATSAVTREGRVLGIVGLYYTKEIDELRARMMLRHLQGDVQTCGGCIYSSAPAGSMMEFLFGSRP